MTLTRDEQLLTGVGPREFFQEAVQAAMSNQQLSACDETVIYIVNLLTQYVRAENLFDKTADGLMLKPLALIYVEALEAGTAGDRDIALKKLGDISLFISGLYAHSLSRSLVDVDYYIQMGGNAYGFLADSSRTTTGSHVLKDVFMELARQFTSFVDILAEVGEQTNINNSSDIMRLYEIWQCTGSKRAANKLEQLGIQPVKIQHNRH